MGNLGAFRKQIQEYLKMHDKKQEDLAGALFMTREHLNKILNGKENMPAGFVHRTVTALVSIGCIRGKDQARMLLELMDVADFPAADWNNEPLSNLKDAVSKSHPAGSVLSILQQETAQRSALSLWNVPYHRNPFFTGRGDLLDRLHRQLIGATTIRRAVLTQSQAIKGLGGIGKTQIAVEYAYRSRDAHRYTHTLWINAATEETIIASFVEIASLIPSLPEKNETDQRKLVAAILRWLEECEQQWLLIFDNADDLSILPGYLPRRGNGSVLLTTRSNADISLTTSIEVEDMSLMEGTKFLLHRARRFDHAVYALDDEVAGTANVKIDEAANFVINEAANLAIALNQFPLALDQAGAYIDETKCSFADYLQMYQKHRRELHEQRGLQATNYPDTVATTWSLSFQKVEEANPAAAELLRLCAFLAPDRIPVELITDGAEHWPPLLQQTATDLYACNQMIRELLKFSLIKRLTDTNTLSVHRLVQAVQIDTMETEVQRNWAERVIRAVDEVFPENTEDPSTWSKCLRYLDQVQVCDTLIKQYKVVLIEVADLLHRTGRYLVVHASYNIAEPLYEQALSVRELLLGPEHSAVAQCLDSLASLYMNQGKYLQAEPLYKRSLSISKQLSGQEHPSTSASLNNLAGLYLLQGKYKHARRLYEQALLTSERCWGPDHPYTAVCLHNLALLYSDQKEDEQAELLYKQALSIREQQLGPNHLDTAYSLSGLGNLYQRQGKYEQAEPLYKQALSIREYLLGPDHPDTARLLSDLATLYQDQGKYEQAEPLCKRALSIHERLFGADHPDIATTLNNLANVYYAQGKYGQAEPLYIRALSISQQMLGSKHLDTLTSVNNLAILYRHQGKYEQAEPLYQQALSTSEQQLGPAHPDTVDCLNNLASFYWDQGKYEQAEPLYQRMLSIHEQQLGPEHPKTMTYVGTLAFLYWDQGKYEQAEPLYQRSHSFSEKQLGPEHPKTVKNLVSLANLYHIQGKHEQAEPLYARALSISTRLLGSEHPDTIAIHKKRASLPNQQ